MIIENNIPNNRNNFNNQNNLKNNNRETLTSMQNTFENRWNTVQEYNKNRQVVSNGFVKNIQDQKYSNISDSSNMHDKALAMLHERLKQGTISLEEFNKKCTQLGKQNMTKNNKLF